MFIVRGEVVDLLLYQFELMMAGVILLSAMVAGGVAIWYRRRKEILSTLNETDNDSQDQEFR